MIRVSSKRPRDAPSFTTNLVVQGRDVACQGHESDDVALTCSFGGYTWLAPLTLVVPSADARRVRALLARGPLAHDAIRMVEPKHAATRDVYLLSTSGLFSEETAAVDEGDVDCLFTNFDEEGDDGFASDCEDP